MKLWKLNPFVRNALHFLYKPKGYPVYIADFHIIYVDSGEMYIRCNGKDMYLPKGSLIHLPSGSVYELYLPNGHETEHPMLAVVDFDLTQEYNSHTKKSIPKNSTKIPTTAIRLRHPSLRISQEMTAFYPKFISSKTPNRCVI